MTPARKAGASSRALGAPRALKAALKRAIPERWAIHLQAADHYLRGEPEIRLLRGLCDRRKAAVDIGANIGTYAYFLRRYAAEVIAYEPNPALAARLRRLFPDVVVRAVGLHDHADTMMLRVPVREGLSLHELGSVSQHFNDDTEIEEYEVEVTSLDAETCARHPIGFIKVDVEQVEIPVLRGAVKTIARDRPNIMSEVTPLLYPAPLPEMFRFILEMEYQGYVTYRGRIMSFAGFRPEAHARREGFPHDFINNNVFFLPREVNPQQAFGRRYAGT
jgi:FkbM family methyltransferase